MELELTPREGPGRCAVCHEEGTTAVEVCDGCGATLHADCRASVDGCSTLGCLRRTAAVREPESSAPQRSRRWRVVGALANGAGAFGLAFSADVLVERLPPGAAVTAQVWGLLAGVAALGLLASGLGLSVVRRRALAVACALVGWALLGAITLPGVWPHVVPVTAAEVHDVADDLERGFAEHDVRRLSKRFNPLSMMRRHLPGLRPGDGDARDFSESTDQTLEQLARGYAERGGFRVLRVVTDQDPPRIVARVANAWGGLDYEVLPVIRDKDGVPRALDIEYLRLSTSWAEETRRFLRAPDTVRRAVTTFLQLDQQGTPEEIVAAFERLEPAARREPVVHRVHVDAAELLGDPERHDAALRGLMRVVRGRSPLLQLELAFVREDVDAGLRAVNAIDRTVGGDPFLDVIRAELHWANDDVPRALELAKSATAAVPEVERGWWVLLGIALEAGDRAATVVTLERLVTSFGAIPEDLEESYDLTSLEGTPEGAAWAALKARGR